MTRPKSKFWFRNGSGKSRRRKKSFTPQQTYTITPRTHPSEWNSWMRYYRFPDVKMHNFAKLCELQGHVTVPSLYPKIEEKSAS